MNFLLYMYIHICNHGNPDRYEDTLCLAMHEYFYVSIGVRLWAWMNDESHDHEDLLRILLTHQIDS